METIIQVQGLTKAYGQLPAVDHVSLSVKAGTVFGLLGANGAGKSTTIECILGTKKADSGEISILSLDPQKDRRRLFQRVGVQFQECDYQSCNINLSLVKSIKPFCHNAFTVSLV